MKLLSFLLSGNKRNFLAVTGLGVLSGLASACLVATVNSALHLGAAARYSKATLAMAFSASMLLKVAASLVSALLLARYTQLFVFNLCTRLCRNVAATDFRN